MTDNPRTIIAEIGAWAEQQPWHPNHAPDYGIVEEFGELMHCILKNIQKIRGFENEEFFMKEAQDAIGDFMVYLSHWCFMNGCYYTLVPFDKVQEVQKLRPTIGQLLIGVSKMFVLSSFPFGDAVCSGIASQIAQNLQIIAKYLGLRIDSCLIITWDKVKQRNWNKNKQTGDA